MQQEDAPKKLQRPATSPARMPIRQPSYKTFSDVSGNIEQTRRTSLHRILSAGTFDEAARFVNAAAAHRREVAHKMAHEQRHLVRVKSRRLLSAKKMKPNRRNKTRDKKWRSPFLRRQGKIRSRRRLVEARKPTPRVIHRQHQKTPQSSVQGSQAVLAMPFWQPDARQTRSASWDSGGDRSGASKPSDSLVLRRQALARDILQLLHGVEPSDPQHAAAVDAASTDTTARTKLPPPNKKTPCSVISEEAFEAGLLAAAKMPSMV